VLGEQAIVALAGVFERRIEAGAGTVHKTPHVGLAAKRLLLLLPFRQNFVGANTALGKDGAVGFGFFQRILPFGLYRL